MFFYLFYFFIFLLIHGYDQCTVKYNVCLPNKMDEVVPDCIKNKKIDNVRDKVPTIIKAMRLLQLARRQIIWGGVIKNIALSIVI
jgi:hypothetical protein